MSSNRVLIAIAVAGAFAAAANIVDAAETPAAKQPRASASLNAQDRGKYMIGAVDDQQFTVTDQLASVVRCNDCGNVQTSAGHHVASAAIRSRLR